MDKKEFTLEEALELIGDGVHVKLRVNGHTYGAYKDLLYGENGNSFKSAISAGLLDRKVKSLNTGSDFVGSEFIVINLSNS